MADLARRSRQPELMDTEPVGSAGVGPARVEIAWLAPFRYRVGCLK